MVSMTTAKNMPMESCWSMTIHADKPMTPAAPILNAAVSVSCTCLPAWLCAALLVR
ncbi:hypothetical protein D3C85_1801290 [compost metagenome]